jgi:hypothetical protein
VGTGDASDPSSIPIVKPTFGAPGDFGKIKSTWLGHAAFLLELPSVSKQESSRGLTFLCDPVFSQRCSPVQVAGPAPRVTRKYPQASTLKLELTNSTACQSIRASRGGRSREPQYSTSHHTISAKTVAHLSQPLRPLRSPYSQRCLHQAF